MIPVGTITLCACRRAIQVAGHDQWGRTYWTHMGEAATAHHPVPLCSRHEPDPRLVELARLEREIENLRRALAALVDPDDCQFDHHGDCQAHGFFGGPCGHAVAKELLARQENR